ncbi:MAG: CPBP family intramembrane metalloprotease, partial [Anaerolineales bacterium]|nr:CPBP family intramembrane metalloprotease [Anaerolineales bacterium]
LLTVVVSGREGLREQLSGLRRWREGAGWYALALLTAPISATAILLALLPFSPEFLPAVSTAENKVSFVLIGIVAGLCVGLFEESGWTGFALPRLRRRFGVVGSGLILGFLWGAWHYILALWGSGTAEGILVLERFLPEMLFYVVVLPVYRVLMVWLYENTGSLLLTVLMHAGLTGTVPNILMPQEITGSGLMAWYLILAAVLWFVVFVAVKAGGGQLSCQPTGAQTD